jgi:hypothetical protein
LKGGFYEKDHRTIQREGVEKRVPKFGSLLIFLHSASLDFFPEVCP